MKHKNNNNRAAFLQQLISKADNGHTPGHVPNYCRSTIEVIKRQGVLNALAYNLRFTCQPGWQEIYSMLPSMLGYTKCPQGTALVEHNTAFIESLEITPRSTLMLVKELEYMASIARDNGKNSPFYKPVK